MTRPPLGIVYVVAIRIDCPRPGCGGGIESPYNGSFTLTDEDRPGTLLPGSTHRCGTCLEPIRIPAVAFRLLARTEARRIVRDMH
jgi:hypothetical protein